MSLGGLTRNRPTIPFDFSISDILAASLSIETKAMAPELKSTSESPLGRILKGFSHGGTIPWGDNELVLFEQEVIRKIGSNGKVTEAVYVRVPHHEITQRLLQLGPARIADLADAIEHATTGARLSIPEVIACVRERSALLHGVRAKLLGAVFELNDESELVEIVVDAPPIVTVEGNTSFLVNSPEIYSAGQPLSNIDSIMRATISPDKKDVYFFGPSGSVDGQFLDAEVEVIGLPQTELSEGMSIR